MPPDAETIRCYRHITVTSAAVVRDTHRDLARRSRLHGAAIEDKWRSFDEPTRALCLEQMMRILWDKNLKITTPEFQEFEAEGFDTMSVLPLFRHRATTSLPEQYGRGIDGGPGDCDSTWKWKDSRGESSGNPLLDKTTGFVFFHRDGDEYGRYEASLGHRDYAQLEAEVEENAKVLHCVPARIGMEVLIRQDELLQGLNILISIIFRQSAEPGIVPARPPPAPPAVSRLTMAATPTVLSLTKLAALLDGQRLSLRRYLERLKTEPFLLATAILIRRVSRPEMVLDTQKLRPPVCGDNHLSGLFFGTILEANKAPIIWSIMVRMLQQLTALDCDSSTTVGSTEFRRDILLQELANICHYIFCRSHAAFRGLLQQGRGRRCFVRDINNKGSLRVSLLYDLSTVLPTSPHLYHLLQVWRARDSLSETTEALKHVNDWHETHPEDRETLINDEINALNDLCTIVLLREDLGKAVSLPPVASLKGQAVVGRLRRLDKKFDRLKARFDVVDLVAPVEILLRSGASQEALAKLDDFVVEQTGHTMGTHFHRVVNDAFSLIEAQVDQRLAQLHEKPYIAPFQIDEPSLPDRVVKVKEKTRPSAPPPLPVIPRDISPPPPDGFVLRNIFPPEQLQTFEVSPTTAAVFNKMLPGPKQGRGSVSWSAFEAAMTELGFSVKPAPGGGSAFTFDPPKKVWPRVAITMHRPHPPKIEGKRVHGFGDRLKKKYGWTRQNFVVV